MRRLLEISRNSFNFNPDYSHTYDIQRLFDYDESIANAHHAGKPVMNNYRPRLREWCETLNNKYSVIDYVPDHLP
jgi:hypothetical protein